MKIYTKTGDDGTTGLFGGKRIPKYALRIESYGTVDELNSFLGLLIVQLDDEKLISFLRTLQSRLFDVGAHLAAVPGKKLSLPIIGEELVEELESAIDALNVDLPDLMHFILPGNGPTNAHAHVCRTVCRRAERLVVALASEEEVETILIKYLNRLSDYFFVLGRWLGHQEGREEVKWIPVKKAKNNE